MRISVVQVNCSQDKLANLAKVKKLVEKCVLTDRPDLVVLPEMIACISADPQIMRDSAEPIPGGPTTLFFSELAQSQGVAIHIGSMMEADGGKIYNCSAVLDRNGVLLGKYRKIHRFDAVFADGSELRESKMVERGESVVCVDCAGVKIGLSICYDIRFPELYRQLLDQGAQVIVVPAAFTFETGSAHWDILLKARAIETQTYIVAPGQVGAYGGGKYKTFGHSIIIDPWGQIVAGVSNVEGYATASIDIDYLNNIRSRMPIRQHRVL